MEILLSISSWISSSPYLNLVFLFLAIVSIFMSIFFYYKGKRTKKPTYLYKSFALIENSISALEGLEIKYNKEQIDTLTLTKFAIWNAGNDIIEGSDIAQADKLRITLPNDKRIINIKPIFNRKVANSITIDIQNNEGYINFDFLDFGDGAIFEIYHTSNHKDKVHLKGIIKGVQNLKWGSYEKDYLSNTITSKIDKIIPEPKNKILKFIYI